MRSQLREMGVMQYAQSKQKKRGRLAVMNIYEKVDKYRQRTKQKLSAYKNKKNEKKESKKEGKKKHPQKRNCKEKERETQNQRLDRHKRVK